MFRCVAVLLPFTLLYAAPAPAQEQEAARKLLHKIIRAKGGDLLPRVEAFHLECRNKVFTDGRETRVESKYTCRGFNFSRMELRDPDHHTINVQRENDGWVREKGQTRDMRPAELEGTRESTYLAWVGMTLPALGEKFTLSRLPDDKIKGRRVLGLRIAHKGRPHLDLWVDAETYLIARQRYKLVQPNGQEVEMVTWVGGHKKYDGVEYYTYFSTFRNGVKFMETEVLDAKFFVDGRKVEFGRP